MRLSACLLPALDPETLDADLGENEIAGKVAGPPCMCQEAPLSAISMLAVGVVMLVATRIPPYLNKDRHMLQLVRARVHLLRLQPFDDRG